MPLLQDVGTVLLDGVATLFAQHRTLADRVSSSRRAPVKCST